MRLSSAANIIGTNVTSLICAQAFCWCSTFKSTANIMEGGKFAPDVKISANFRERDVWSHSLQDMSFISVCAAVQWGTGTNCDECITCD
jgi:hypothetical protein